MEATGDPRNWSVEQVVAWVRKSIPQNSTADAFRAYIDNEIDGESMIEYMDLNILCKYLNIAVGPAMRIMGGIRDLRRQWNVVPTDLNSNELQSTPVQPPPQQEIQPPPVQQIQPPPVQQIQPPPQQMQPQQMQPPSQKQIQSIPPPAPPKYTPSRKRRKPKQRQSLLDSIPKSDYAHAILPRRISLTPHYFVDSDSDMSNPTSSDSYHSDHQDQSPERLFLDDIVRPTLPIPQDQHSIDSVESMDIEFPESSEEYSDSASIKGTEDEQDNAREPIHNTEISNTAGSELMVDNEAAEERTAGAMNKKDDSDPKEPGNGGSKEPPDPKTTEPIAEESSKEVGNMPSEESVRYIDAGSYGDDPAGTIVNPSITKDSSGSEEATGAKAADSIVDSLVNEPSNISAHSAKSVARTITEHNDIASDDENTSHVVSVISTGDKSAETEKTNKTAASAIDRPTENIDNTNTTPHKPNPKPPPEDNSPELAESKSIRATDNDVSIKVLDESQAKSNKDKPTGPRSDIIEIINSSPEMGHMDSLVEDSDVLIDSSELIVSGSVKIPSGIDQVPPKPTQTDQNKNTTSASLPSQDPKVSIPVPTKQNEKTKRRLAPTLLTNEIPAQSSGNLVAPLVTAELATRSTLISFLEFAFPEFKERHRRFLLDQEAKGLVDEPIETVLNTPRVPHYFESDSEDIWFRRFRSNNSKTQPNAAPKIQLLMKRQLLYDDSDSGDDRVLPLYGDSGDSGEYPKTVLTEMRHEQNELIARRRKVHAQLERQHQRVRKAIDEMTHAFAADWESKERPRLERKAHFLWRRNQTKSNLLSQELNHVCDSRLPKIKKSIIDSGESSERNLRVLCEGLRPSIYKICEIRWLLDLVSKPRPCKPDPVTSVVDGSPPALRSKVRVVTESSSLDDLDDFIVKDSKSHKETARRPTKSANTQKRATNDNDNDKNKDNSNNINDTNKNVKTDSEQSSWSAATGRVATTDTQTQPKMELLAFGQQVIAHTELDLYEAATAYIAQVSRGINLSEVNKPKSGIEMRLALRVWSEFMSWITSVQPSIAVEYPTREHRDRVASEIESRTSKQNKLTTIHDDLANSNPRHIQKSMCRGLSDVADSLIKCNPPLYPRIIEPKHESAQNEESASNVLVISSRESPGLVLSIDDGGFARRRAFGEFYKWKRTEVALIADNAAVKMELPEHHAKVKSRRRGGIGAKTKAKDRPQYLKLYDDSDEEYSEDKSDSDALLISKIHAEGGSDSDALLVSRLPAEDIVEASGAVPQIQSELSVQKTPTRGRRNIRAVREENSQVLELRIRQLQAEQEIQQRIQQDNKRRAHETPAEERGAKAARVDGPTVADVDIDAIGSPLLVNLGHSEVERDVRIPGFLAQHLKSHQIEGVQFMWKNLVMMSDTKHDPDTQKTFRTPSHGCILAHSMGLGKTLQTIVLVYTLLNEVFIENPDIVNSSFATRRVLILCPPTLQSNWVSEFYKWTGVGDSSCSGIAPVLPAPYTNHPKATARIRRRSRQVITQVINFSLIKQQKDRESALEAWRTSGGVVIMGYSTFREIMQNNATTAINESTSAMTNLAKYLTDTEHGPCLVVADEGHCIKNPKTQLSKHANMIETKARICLTGYPLQNNLEEYWTMVDFCFPRFLGDLAYFRNAYVNPINNGLYVDSTEMDKRTSWIQMNTLQRLLEQVIDRRDTSVLLQQLPRKVEYIISCPLTKTQHALYVAYLVCHFGIGITITKSDGSPSIELDLGNNRHVIAHSGILLTICNHPAIVKAVIEAKRAHARESRSRPLVHPTDTLEVEEGEIEEIVPDDQDVDEMLANGTWTKVVFDSHKDLVPLSTQDSPKVPDLKLPQHSTKAMILLDIIRECVSLGERVLVFSRSIPTLDYLEWLVKTTGVAVGEYTPDVCNSTLRLDGATPIATRQRLIDKFNDTHSPYYVFFVSTGTGSLGVNLVAASRVVLFDIGWNPLYDEQAVARAFRYGQTRNVFVYRLLTTGTWEEKLFGNNIFKVGLTRRVVDKQSMGRRISKQDMRSYFAVPNHIQPCVSPGDASRLLSRYGSDSVFARLVKMHRTQISKITPRATLIANEDDNVSKEDLDMVQIRVQSERMRLGQITPAEIHRDHETNLLQALAAGTESTLGSVQRSGDTSKKQTNVLSVISNASNVQNQNSKSVSIIPKPTTIPHASNTIASVQKPASVQSFNVQKSTSNIPIKPATAPSLSNVATSAPNSNPALVATNTKSMNNASVISATVPPSSSVVSNMPKQNAVSSTRNVAIGARKPVATRKPTAASTANNSVSNMPKLTAAQTTTIPKSADNVSIKRIATPPVNSTIVSVPKPVISTPTTNVATSTQNITAAQVTTVPKSADNISIKRIAVPSANNNASNTLKKNAISPASSNSKNPVFSLPENNAITNIPKPAAKSSTDNVSVSIQKTTATQKRNLPESNNTGTQSTQSIGTDTGNLVTSAANASQPLNKKVKFGLNPIENMTAKDVQIKIKLVELKLKAIEKGIKPGPGQTQFKALKNLSEKWDQKIEAYISRKESGWEERENVIMKELDRLEWRTNPFFTSFLRLVALRPSSILKAIQSE